MKNESELSFDVEFRQKDNEVTIWGGILMKYHNTDLFSISNEIYDNLHDGYELWVKDSKKNSISIEHIDYVISIEAENMLDDGLPLEYRIVNNTLVIWQDLNSLPFGRKAREFYEKFLDRKIFEEEFPEEEKEDRK